MISSCIERGDLKSIKIALEDIDINEELETYFESMPPFLYLCKMSHVFKNENNLIEAMESMVKKGADIHFIHEDLGNCFNMVFNSDSIINEPTARRVTEFLLKNKVAIEAPDSSGLFDYPVAVALSKKYFSCVELFIEYGCDLTPRKLGIKESIGNFLSKNYPKASPGLLAAIIQREVNNELKSTQFRPSQKIRI